MKAVNVIYESLILGSYRIEGNRFVYCVANDNNFIVNKFAYDYIRIKVVINSDNDKKMIYQTIDEIKEKILEQENIKLFRSYIATVFRKRELGLGVDEPDEPAILYGDVYLDYERR